MGEPFWTLRNVGAIALAGVAGMGFVAAIKEIVAGDMYSVSAAGIGAASLLAVYLLVRRPPPGADGA
jgi:hypothetical protein